MLWSDYVQMNLLFSREIGRLSKHVPISEYPIGLNISYYQGSQLGF